MSSLLKVQQIVGDHQQMLIALGLAIFAHLAFIGYATRWQIQIRVPTEQQLQMLYYDLPKERPALSPASVAAPTSRVAPQPARPESIPETEWPPRPGIRAASLAVSATKQKKLLAAQPVAAPPQDETAMRHREGVVSSPSAPQAQRSILSATAAAAPERREVQSAQSVAAQKHDEAATRPSDSLPLSSPTAALKQAAQRATAAAIPAAPERQELQSARHAVAPGRQQTTWRRHQAEESSPLPLQVKPEMRRAAALEEQPKPAPRMREPSPLDRRAVVQPSALLQTARAQAVQSPRPLNLERALTPLTAPKRTPVIPTAPNSQQQARRDQMQMLSPKTFDKSLQLKSARKRSKAQPSELLHDPPRNPVVAPEDSVRFSPPDAVKRTPVRKAPRALHVGTDARETLQPQSVTANASNFEAALLKPNQRLRAVASEHATPASPLKLVQPQRLADAAPKAVAHETIPAGSLPTAGASLRSRPTPATAMSQAVQLSSAWPEASLLRPRQSPQRLKQSAQALAPTGAETTVNPLRQTAGIVPKGFATRRTPPQIVEAQTPHSVAEPQALRLPGVQVRSHPVIVPDHVATLPVPSLSPSQGIVQSATPRYRYNPPPSYPDAARREGIQGTVMLEVLVGDDGLARVVRLRTSSGNRLLDAAAQRSVASWRFHPARHDGKAVSAWVIVPILFQLADPAMR